MGHQKGRPRVIPVLLGLLVLGAMVTHAYIGTGLSYPPPASGALGYNSYVPPNTPGATYVDPIFGSTVRRLTTDHGPDDIYARNLWWNADSTKFLHNSTVIDAQTGTVTHTGVPKGSFGGDQGFDPADPNAILYLQGSTLHKVTLQSGGAKTDVVYFTAPSSLSGMGGSINWLDASGRYMLLRYGSEPSIHLYDRQNLAAGPYNNALSGSEIDSGAYMGLTPDGKFVVSGKRAWSINHATRTVSNSSTYYWDLCGDHGSFISASDGRNYKVTGNCNDAPELWSVDITNDVQGLGPNGQKAGANNKRLLVFPSWTFGKHVSTAGKGPFRDWAFVSVEDDDDNINGPVAPWQPYRSEIIAVNALTGEIRRLVHHRSRSMLQNYYHQPRLSVSWDGSQVAFASNFNRDGVVDIFVTPGVSSNGPSAPTNLRILP